jgi:hypothetical protein
MLMAQPLVTALLDSFPEPAAIINRQRQIVLANDKMQSFASASDGQLLGQRMGEALGCEYSHELPAGCGTTPACELCGAAKAIQQTQATRQPAHEECRITLSPERGHESLDLGVWTTPGDVEGEPFTVFAIKDTSADQRRLLVRHPPDLLITTPESLYLMLTSQARETLAGVEAVIIDEIHAVAATKRGSHLALTLERLEEVCDRAPQRIGLSATQRPLDEIARFLGGYDSRGGAPAPRPVTIVDAGVRKQLDELLREFRIIRPQPEPA